MNFKEISQQYLNSPDFSQLTETTRINYISKIKYLTNMPGDTNVRYQSILKLKVGNGTKNIYVSVLKTVLSWGFRQKLIDEDLVARLPRKRLVETPQQDYYTIEEIEAVKAGVKTKKDKIYGYFLVALFYTGARPSELHNLTWDDVGENYISIKGSKKREEGKVSRMCTITPEVADVLDFFKSIEYFPGSKEPVFKTVTGVGLSPSYTRRQVKRIVNGLGLKAKQLRCARAGLATAMLKAGYDIYAVQGQLGHKSIGTTTRYLRPSLEEKANMFKGL